MDALLYILLAVALAAVVYVLARGVIAMAHGKDASGEVQQGYMRKRVQYQAIAVVIVILILLLASGGRG